MVHHLNRFLRCLATLLCSVTIAGCASVLQAQETTLQLDPASTTIHFTLGASLHTVHGTFRLKSGVIHFNPATGQASGVITVDATSAETGNNSRDRKMHREILESQRFPEITFSPRKVSPVPISLRGNSTVQVDGTFRLHGDDHPVTLSLAVEVSGATIAVKTHFLIPYVAWGLKNPSTFLLRVSDHVDVEIAADARLPE